MYIINKSGKLVVPNLFEEYNNCVIGGWGGGGGMGRLRENVTISA